MNYTKILEELNQASLFPKRLIFLFEQHQKLLALPQAKATKEPKTSAKKPMAELS